MGIITSLIRANEEKKHNDFEEKVGYLKEIAGLPNASDNLRNWALTGVGTLTAEKLGLPKKAHGPWGQLIAGLANLNPMPKDQYAGKVGPPPTTGDVIAKGTQNTETDQFGGKLPDAPDYKTGVYLNEEQVAERNARSAGAVSDAQYGSMYQQQELAAKRKMQDQLAVLDQNKDQFTPEQYQFAKARIISGGNVGAGTAGEKKDRIKIKLADGNIIDAEYGQHSGQIYPIGGGEAIDMPPGAEIIQQARPVADPAKFREKKLEYIKLGFSEPEADKMAAWFLQTQDQTNLERTRQQAQNASQQNQLQGEFSGVSGNRPGATPPPFLSPGHPNTKGAGAPGTPGPGVSGTPQPVTQQQSSASGPATVDVGSTSQRQPVSDGATAKLPPRKPEDQYVSLDTRTGKWKDKDGKPSEQVAGPATAGASSPVAVQHAIDTDKQVGLAVKSMLGLLKGGRNLAVQSGIAKGMDKLKKITGIQDDNALATEVTERENTRKALGMGALRLAAYDQSAGFVDAMAKAVIQAKQKFGNDPKFWQRLKNNVENGYLGDPDTDALVTAVNGYQSAYSRVMSGGQMSTAQTHVAAQERAGQVIDIAMKTKEIKRITKQVRMELDNEREAIVDNNARMRKSLSAQWGQFASQQQAAQRTNRLTEGQKVTLRDGRTVVVGKIHDDGTFDPK